MPKRSDKKPQPKYPTRETLAVILDRCRAFLEAWKLYQGYEKVNPSGERYCSSQATFGAMGGVLAGIMALDAALCTWYLDRKRSRKDAQVSWWPMSVGTVLFGLREFTNPLIRSMRLKRSRPFNPQHPFKAAKPGWRRATSPFHVLSLIERRGGVRPVELAVETLEKGIGTSPMTDNYERILDAIRQRGASFEASPSTYAVHDEDELRHIILADLSVHCPGEATGETFRKRGKTDIRIEDKERAAFVAECKVWRGARELSKAMDQLLRYLTWRDRKTALVIFNKDVAGFSRIQKSLPKVLRAHPNHVKSLKTRKKGEWRFVLRSKEDPKRDITVHVFLFNLYVAGR